MEVSIFGGVVFLIEEETDRQVNLSTSYLTLLSNSAIHDLEQLHAPGFLAAVIISFTTAKRSPSTGREGSCK